MATKGPKIIDSNTNQHFHYNRPKTKPPNESSPTDPPQGRVSQRKIHTLKPPFFFNFLEPPGVSAFIGVYFFQRLFGSRTPVRQEG